MSDDPVAVCELCGKPMPEGEGMFRYHGYSGPCPGPHEDAASDPVAAALAWCNQPLMVVGDSELLNALAVARMHAANLAAEVRRLQAAHTMQVGLLEACEDLGVQLESAKRRQQQAEADRDSAAALYGVERADRQQAEAEVRRLQADVASYGDGHLCHPTRSMASDSGGVCAHCGRTLHASLDYDDDLAKAEAALLEQRCETCKHRFVGMAPAGRPHYAYCKRTMTPIPELGTQTYATCEMLGNGCRAWARREP